jgi:putative MATE family efflux protein
MPDIITDATPRVLRQNIFRLGWPAILRLLLQSIVGVVDVIMIGKLGAAAIAAVDMANRLVFVLIGTLMALTIATTALVAQHVGAGDYKKANHIMWQSLLGGLVAALFLATVGILLSRQMLGLMMILMEEADPFILSEGSAYLRIVFASMVFALPMMVINAVLQGLGDMKTPLFIMMITNVINVVFNYFLIFGIGFFPALGVQGAAWGTSLARLSGAIIGVIVLMRGTADIRLHRSMVVWRLDWPIIRSILKIGIPAALEQLVRQSSMIIYTGLVAGLGTVTLAANAITMNINSLSFMPGFGFGTAATTLVGQAIGAQKKDLATAYGKQTAYITAVLLAVASVFMYIWVVPIVDLYTDDPEVIRLAASALRIFILFQPLFGVFMVLAGALRGAGDTKWVMYITTIGNWGIRLLFSYYFVFVLDLGLDGFWLAMGVDIVMRTALIIWRFQTGKWRDIKVISRKAQAVR